MFLSLFYLLRANRLKVSLDEWLMLLEGMRKGLHGSTLDGFYTLCRAVVVTSEVDFDRFDQVFLEFFQGVEPPRTAAGRAAEMAGASGADQGGYPEAAEVHWPE